MITYLKGTYTCTNCGNKLEIKQNVNTLPPCEQCENPVYSTCSAFVPKAKIDTTDEK